MSRSLTCLFSTSKRNVGRLAWCKRRDNFQFIYTSKKYSTSHSSVDLPIIIPTKGVPIHLYTHEIEPDVMTQLQVLAESPLPTGHIAVMPDVHLGEGVAIGTVFASEKYICPNAVGVDIGCGVAAVPIEGLYLHDLSHANRLEIQRRLKERIPTGFEQRRSMWEGAKNILDDISNELKPSSYLEDQLHLPRVTDQLGTLGGGNHFLEVVHNASDGQVWAMLHSGSRNVGNRVARHYDQAAQHYLQTEEGIDIKSLKGLHYMPIDSTQGFDYIQDMVWCQKYAFHNRRIMKQVMLEIIEQVTGRVPDMTKAINVHHNFCACETCNGRKLWITRKGATSAKMGQFGLIPGSMGTGSYITRGLGNDQSWNSSSHGADRKMSRTRAHYEISQDDFEESMKGIVCDVVPGVKDEAPQAYKDLGEVMKDQQSLTEVVSRLLPIVNVKGFEEKVQKKYRRKKNKK